MINYSLNMMGPIDLKWYTDRGIPVVNGCPEQIYYGGRIDIGGLSHDAAYSVPLMKAKYWQALSEYLRGYKSNELVPCERLLEEFEENVHVTIEWWEDE